MITNIITRFAPSPTGYLHIGNIRSALYSWLYARKNNGKFILRIDDTEYNKLNKKYSDYILYSLEWLGLYWDDKVYYQSDRIEKYINIINYMLSNNLAYKCFCSVDRLNYIRNICIKKGLKPKYDNFCRNKNFNYKNIPYVVRFKNPLNKNISFNDIIFKKIIFNNNQLDDFIIQRSNGIPTYNFCVVIDDYDMSISHIIRGEDHINNTPKQINILKSLKYNIPKYIHLPIILDENKKKISKKNFLFNIKNYIYNGYLPISILNYLLNLGRFCINNKFNSIYEMKYINNLFGLNKSPCIVNNKKILFLNKYYLNNISYKKIKFYFKYFIINNKILLNNIKNLDEIISFILVRSYSIKDIVNFCLIFNNKIYFNPLLILKYTNKNSLLILLYLYKNIFNLLVWDIRNINLCIKKIIKKFKKIKIDYIFKILHFFITGKEFSPSIIKIIFLFKKKNILMRLKYCIKKYLLRK